MTAAQLRLVVEAGEAQQGLSALSDILERGGELGQRLVDLIESGAQVVRIHTGRGMAVRAGECGIRLELSDPFAQLVEQAGGAS